MKNKFGKVLSLALAIIMVFSVGVFSNTTVFAAPKNTYSKYIKYRGQNLQNTHAKINSGKDLTVAYYGGSVTNGTGVSDTSKSWRGLIGQWLENNFDNNINNVNLAIGGTGSKYGAYRLNHNVISLKPDLIFVEFSINDFYDYWTEKADGQEYSIRFESIIRNIRTELPECDIITILTTEKSHVNINQAGELHAQAKEHEMICEAYNVPSIHVGRAISDKVGAGWTDEKWGEYFYNSSTNSLDIVHPNEKGYEVYYEVIEEYFYNCLKQTTYNGTIKNHTVPRMVNDFLIDGNIQYIDVDKELVTKSNQLGGRGYEYYRDGYLKVIDEDGAMQAKEDASVFVVEFTGTEIAIADYTKYGNNKTIDSYRVSVDGGNEYVVGNKIDPTVLATDLDYGVHTVEVIPVFKQDGAKVQHIKGFFVRDQRKQSAKYDHEHRYDVYVSNKDATCKKDGTKTAKCYRAGCDKTKTVTDVGSRRTHKFETVATKKATLSKNGTGELICSYCGDFKDMVTIYKIKSVKASNCEYNGKAQIPSITVKNSKGKIVSSKYYTVKGYGSRKSVGKYKVKVTFKGIYKGSKTIYFNVTPPKYNVKKLVAGKKLLKVILANKSKQVKGYELEYSTSKKFTKSATKKKTVKSYKKTSLTLKGLKPKKNYYVRVRTYKTVKGKKYYSAWCKVVKKKVK